MGRLMEGLKILLFLPGLALLLGGAEFLVRGASRLAAKVGVSPLVIGLTVVAFGTSAPELSVSLGSAFNGRVDIAFGNVVGSNIFNVLVILGLAALISPLAVNLQLIRFEVPLMVGISALVLLFGLDGVVNRWEGLLLFAGIIAYTVWAVRESRKESQAVKAEFAKEYQAPAAASPWIQIGLIALGLAMLVLGAEWLVEGAVALATWAGLSELVIGLTIVAMGTSLPEVATSVVAALRGERDIAVGNVIGSNLFNIMAVLGLTAAVAPGGVAVSPAALNFDVPVMIAVSLVCLPVFISGAVIDRWEGGIFLLYYALYAAFLVLKSTRHDMIQAFADAVLTFVLPLTLVTLAFIFWREFRKSGRRP
jgi:cation:H+ antiporter